jgi:hypothetical protein
MILSSESLFQKWTETYSFSDWISKIYNQGSTEHNCRSMYLDSRKFCRDKRTTMCIEIVLKSEALFQNCRSFGLKYKKHISRTKPQPRSIMSSLQRSLSPSTMSLNRASTKRLFSIQSGPASFAAFASLHPWSSLQLYLEREKYEWGRPIGSYIDVAAFVRRNIPHGTPLYSIYLQISSAVKAIWHLLCHVLLGCLLSTT